MPVRRVLLLLIALLALAPGAASATSSLSAFDGGGFLGDGDQEV